MLRCAHLYIFYLSFGFFSFSNDSKFLAYCAFFVMCVKFSYIILCENSSWHLISHQVVDLIAFSSRLFMNNSPQFLLYSFFTSLAVTRLCVFCIYYWISASFMIIKRKEARVYELQLRAVSE